MSKPYVEINLTVGEYEGPGLRANVAETMRQTDDEAAHWQLFEALNSAFVEVLKGWVEDYARARGDL